MADCLGLMQCGTRNGYDHHGCRSELCRQAKRDENTRRRRILAPVLVKVGPRRADLITPVLCTHCRNPIEHCEGRHGDWMHTADRSEFCGPQRLASPETPEQVGRVSA